MISFFSNSLFAFVLVVLYTLRMTETETKRVFVTERQRNCIPRVLHTIAELHYSPVLREGPLVRRPRLRPRYLGRWGLG